MQSLRRPAMADVGSLVLRLAIGASFIVHGLPKLQTAGKFVGFFGKIGIPMPEFFVPFVGFWEVAGGACLIIGLLTRFWALGLAVNMLVAILAAKGLSKFMGYELELSLLAASASLFLTGAGRYSADAKLMKKAAPAQPIGPVTMKM